MWMERFGNYDCLVVVFPQDGILHGFASWFSVEFGGSEKVAEVVVLNTGPEHQ